jgi:hypothetical protein
VIRSASELAPEAVPVVRVDDPARHVAPVDGATTASASWYTSAFFFRPASHDAAASSPCVGDDCADDRGKSGVERGDGDLASPLRLGEFEDRAGSSDRA